MTILPLTSEKHSIFNKIDNKSINLNQLAFPLVVEITDPKI